MRSTREFTLHQSEFDTLRNLVLEKTGIRLKEGKIEMVYSRLARRIRALSLESFADYLVFLKGPDGRAEMADFVNAMTTNLTRFFREGHHFTHLRNEVLKPRFQGAKMRVFDKSFRVWSAGCSSGMEPYSTAMTMLASIPRGEKWNLQILATDIDTNMLDRGRAGLYRQADGEGIPAALMSRFVHEKGGQICMDDCLKNIIHFKQLNLMENWPMKKPFDVIFCRNVMIYFDTATQKKLIDRFVHMLVPNGVLYVGHAEALVASHPKLLSIGKSTFLVKDDSLPESA